MISESMSPISVLKRNSILKLQFSFHLALIFMLPLFPLNFVLRSLNLNYILIPGLFQVV